MLVSVLVPVLNEEAHIREAVHSMRAQRIDGEVEFLFVDGRSSDRTREILQEVAREDGRFRVLDNPAQRTPNGLNIGLREARGEFVARMDGHAEYPPDYLARAVDRLRRGDVAWVCGPQIPVGAGKWSNRVALALHSQLGTGGSKKWSGALDGAPDAEDGESEVEPDSGIFTGVWRRSTLEEGGGWDEGWPVNQDSEMLARIQESGGRVVLLPELGARYVPRDSLEALGRQYWRFGLYRAKTALHHPQTLRRAHLLPPGLALTVAATLLGPRRVRRPARVGLAVYALTLTAVAARSAASADRRDAASLPAVFSVMHLGWGAGFVAGCLRFGVPIRALARALGVGRG